MRKMLIAAVLLAGCSGDDGPQDPHELLACEYNWNHPGLCEAACVIKGERDGAFCDFPSIDMGPGRGSVSGCSSGFDFEGVRGCCLPIRTDDGDGFMLFAVCNP